MLVSRVRVAQVSSKSFLTQTIAFWKSTWPLFEPAQQLLAMGAELQPVMQARGSKGHFWACFLCWLLGVAFLFPWNALLTIEDYYYAVFPKDHPSRVFTLIYQPVALATTCIYTWYEARCSTRWRVLAGYLAFFFLMLFLIIVDLATSGRGSVGAFTGVCLIIAGLGIANGTAQGALVGDLSFMTPVYIQAFSGGLAMSGIATTVLRMITKVSFGSAHSGLRKGALTFFGIAAFTEFAGLLLYAFVFPRLAVVKAFRLIAQQQGSFTVNDDLAAAGVQAGRKDVEIGKPPARLSVAQLCVQNWDYLFDMVVIYILSLSIFPGFLYENTGTHHLRSWYVLVLVALYNAGDFVGRYIPLIKPLLLESRIGLLLACLARFGFIPCFYFAARSAGEGWMIFLCTILGLTNGHLTVCIFMIAPRGYSSPEQHAIGNLLVLFLILGLTLGVTADWLWLVGKGW